MPNFNVLLGRLVKEEARVVVSAKSLEDLEGRLYEIYSTYDGPWHPDTEWESEPSKTYITGIANPSKVATIVLK